MKLKKILAALLSAALILGGSLTAMAAEPTTDLISAPSAGQPATPQQTKVPYTTGTAAVIKEVNVSEEGSAYVLVKIEDVNNPNGQNGQEIRLNVDKKTVLMDTQTARPIAIKDLKKDEKVYVYHSTAMTKSIPPQASAQAILVNLDEKHAPAHLLTAESVTVGSDGSVTLLAEGGSILVKITKDTPISSLYSKNIVRNTDVRMGMQVMAWYDAAAMSMPAQATATKVVVLPSENRERPIVTEDNTTIGTGKIVNGVIMVPIRVVGEKLGYTITWDEKTKTVGLSDGTSKTSVQLGTDNYYKAAENGTTGMGAPISLGAASYEEEGVSWAPAEMFNLLKGNPVVTVYGDTIRL